LHGEICPLDGLVRVIFFFLPLLQLQVGWSSIVLHSSTRTYTTKSKTSGAAECSTPPLEHIRVRNQGEQHNATSTQVRSSSILLHSSLHVSAQLSLLNEQLTLYKLADLIVNYMAKLMIFRLIYSCIHLHIFTYINRHLYIDYRTSII